MVQQIVPLVLLHMREGMDTETMQPFIGSTWRLIQNVVIAKTPGHQPASLEVRGQIASILAAMDAATIMEKRFETLARPDSLERLRAGELDTDAKRKKLLDAYAEELDVKETELSNSQVFLVAGARNHLNLHFLSTCLRVLEQMAAGNHGDLFRTAA